MRAGFTAVPSSRRGAAAELIGVALLFALLGAAATWPLITGLSTKAVSGPENNDVFLNQYLIFWGAHALTTEPWNLHHTNMFHPSRNGFAYADMLLTDSIALYPVIALFRDPNLTYNVLLLFAVVLGGVGMYALARLFVGGRLPALAAAVLMVFNAGHFVRYRQPQFFVDCWLAWFLWALFLWMAASGLWRPPTSWGLARPERALRWAAAAAFLYCLHALTGSHNAVFGLLLGGLAVLYYGLPVLLSAATPWPTKRRALAGAALMAGIGVVVLVPAFYPYFQVEDWLLNQRLGGAEAPHVLQEGAARPLDLLTGGSRFYTWLSARVGWPESWIGSGRRVAGHLFPGLVLPLLGLLGLLGAGVRWRRPSSWRVVLVALLDAAGTLAALLALAAWLLGRRRFGLGTIEWAAPSVWLYAAVTLLAAGARRLVGGEHPHLAQRLAACLRRAAERDRDRVFWTLAFLFFFVAALGPAFGLVQLLQGVPGVRLIRVPARYVLPAWFCLSVLAAWAVERLRRQRGARILLAGLALWFAVESTFAPLPWAPAPYQPSDLSEWLAEQAGDFAVLEIPIDPNPTKATRQMVQSVWHWKKLLIGYSGSAPPGYEERMTRLRRGFPGDAALDELAALGVRYLTVIEARTDESVLAAMQRSPRLRYLHHRDGFAVWELIE